MLLPADTVYGSADRDADPQFSPDEGGTERALLDQCRLDWEAMSDYRERRRRMRDLRRGRHWNQLMDDPDNPGKVITEEEYIKRQGRVPHKMNHASPAIRNLVGQLLENRSERAAFAVDREDNQAAEQMTVALRAVRRLNRSRLIETSQFEEHLVSGAHVWKATSDYFPNLDRDDVVVEPVHPNRVFWNRDIEDRRLTGLRRIGEIHDLTLDDLVSALARDPEHEAEIRALYGDTRTPEDRRLTGFFEHEDGPAGHRAYDGIDFLVPQDAGHVRVIEVWHVKYQWVTIALDPVTGWMGKTDWTEDELAAENAYREEVGMPPIEYNQRKEPVWHYCFLTPQAQVIEEGETPYWHEEPPYVVGFAGYMDGEFWGLLEDIEDPQRLINRLTVAVDHMMAAAAKGVLIVDEQVLDDSQMTLDEIASEWVKFNGVVALKLRPGVPVNQQIQQITAAAIPAGLFEWMGQQKQWVEELSGVTGTVQGRAQQSGTPASLYAQQREAASLTTAIYFETFFQTLYELDRKIIQIILQYYDAPRLVASGAEDAPVEYDPERVREIDFDVSMGDTADTAVYRQLFEQSLMEFKAAGDISFRQFLEVSSHPRAQQLLQLIERTNPLLQEPTALDSASQTNPELVGALMQAAQAGDMEARTLLMQAENAPGEAAMQPVDMMQPAEQPF